MLPGTLCMCAAMLTSVLAGCILGALAGSVVCGAIDERDSTKRLAHPALQMPPNIRVSGEHPHTGIHDVQPGRDRRGEPRGYSRECADRGAMGEHCDSVKAWPLMPPGKWYSRSPYIH